MVHALSQKAKKLQARQRRQAREAQAVEDWHLEQKKPEGQRRSDRKIAEDHDIPQETFRRRIKGGKSIDEVNASKQKLSPAVEHVLVDHILMQADRGFPPTRKVIVKTANAILISQGRSDALIKLESNWIETFITRHRARIQGHWSRPLDTQRAQCLNPEAVEGWFDLILKFIVNTGIRPEDIYGMDESGFPPLDPRRMKVYGARGTKTQHKQGGADRENVTAIITICADGTALAPTIIFKGKNIMKSWGENNVAGAS
jgi:hypothetical protein